MTMDSNIVFFATNNVKHNHTTFKANYSRIGGGGGKCHFLVEMGALGKNPKV